VETTTAAFSSSVTPGAFFVDFIPWCTSLWYVHQKLIKDIPVKYVPTWFPGAGFRRLAARWRKDLFAVADIAHNFTKDQVERYFCIRIPNGY
jgi:hypothetical protein